MNVYLAIGVPTTLRLCRDGVPVHEHVEIRAEPVESDRGLALRLVVYSGGEPRLPEVVYLPEQPKEAQS